VLLPLLSITDQLAEWVTSVVEALGLPGIFLLMSLESACIPIPSEPTMLFAGFVAFDGGYPLWAPVVVASVANLVGSWVAWAAGFYGRVDLLEKQRFVHISPRHLAWADRWFERHGDATVFFSRMLPIIRTFISLPAGIAKMPFWRFSVLTFLGAIPWNLMLVYIGYELGARWDDARDYLHFIDYAVAAAIIAGVVYLAVRWWRGRGGGTPAVDAA
jgi:membrane protein DedA with SNARE-associated domain